MAVCGAAAVQCTNTFFGIRGRREEMDGARRTGPVWPSFERRSNCRSIVATVAVVVVVIVAVIVGRGVGVGVEMQMGEWLCGRGFRHWSSRE